MSQISEHLNRAINRVLADAGEVLSFRGRSVKGVFGQASLKDTTKFSDDIYPAWDIIIQIKEEALDIHNPPRVDEELCHNGKRYKIQMVEYRDGSAPHFNLFVKGDLST